MRVGYVRCSTADQNEARQLKMMEEQKAEKIFTDKLDITFQSTQICVLHQKGKV